MNRTQTLVLAFEGTAVAGLLLLNLVAPNVLGSALRPLPPLAVVGIVLALAVLLSVLAVGVWRRWRWTFWLVMIAFVSGALRIPVSALQLDGALPTSEPGWYVVAQGLTGLVQVGIGLLMIRGYRRAGVWGPF